VANVDVCRLFEVLAWCPDELDLGELGQAHVGVQGNLGRHAWDHLGPIDLPACDERLAVELDADGCEHGEHAKTVRFAFCDQTRIPFVAAREAKLARSEGLNPRGFGFQTVVGRDPQLSTDQALDHRRRQAAGDVDDREHGRELRRLDRGADEAGPQVGTVVVGPVPVGQAARVAVRDGQT